MSAASLLLLFRRLGTSSRCFSSSVKMAKSNYEYVKKFELEERCLPETWMVVRLDGRCFHKYVLSPAGEGLKKIFLVGGVITTLVTIMVKIWCLDP